MFSLVSRKFLAMRNIALYSVSHWKTIKKSAPSQIIDNHCTTVCPSGKIMNLNNVNYNCNQQVLRACCGSQTKSFHDWGVTRTFEVIRPSFLSDSWTYTTRNGATCAIQCACWYLGEERGSLQVIFKNPSALYIRFYCVIISATHLFKKKFSLLMQICMQVSRYLPHCR